MIKGKISLRNAMLYGGLTKEEYTNIGGLIHKSNVVSINVLGVIVVMFLGIVFFISLFFPDTVVGSGCYAYLMGMIISLTILILNGFIGERNAKITELMGIALRLSMYAMSIYIDAYV